VVESLLWSVGERRVGYCSFHNAFDCPGWQPGASNGSSVFLITDKIKTVTFIHVFPP